MPRSELHPGNHPTLDAARDMEEGPDTLTDPDPLTGDLGRYRLILRVATEVLAAFA